MDIFTGAEEGPIDCELVDIDVVSGTVQFVKEIIPGPTPIEKPITKVLYSLYRQADRLEAFRGYPVPWKPTSEEQLSPNISHLVLVAHGIGEALYNRENDPLQGSLRFRGNCDIIRQHLNDRIFETNPESGRIEVLPIEWSQAIHSNFFDRRLESVTLPNLAGVRDFANLALADVNQIFRKK